MSQEKEEQKISDNVPEQQHNKGERYDLSYVHISSDIANSRIILEPGLKGKNDDQKKCKLFKINKGKQLIYNSMLEIFNSKKEQNNDIKQVEIVLTSKTTTSYMLIQALADLQFNNILTIKSTKDNTTQTTYEIEVTVVFTKND